ncbi:hypothetical protein PMNALOAF_0027 [Methylobacterium adhaesivum]|nr:hypothetical protein PMNALOAF_0027 [Methylobacterium adhaesivum]
MYGSANQWRQQNHGENFNYRSTAQTPMHLIPPPRRELKQF